MIIVWGCIEAKMDSRDDLLRLSLEHVHRSRAEPGCIRHSVQIDAENPNRLVFFEEWRDMPALQTHFGVPESGAFVKRAAALAVSPPEIKTFEATAVG